MVSRIWAGRAQLRDLSDFRGDDLVNGILGLVERHDPIHLSLVGGEPLIRHRELSRVLPVLSARGTNTLIVTSAVIPIPQEWMALPTRHRCRLRRWFSARS